MSSKYKNIIELVQKQNNISIYDITIAGEGVNGLYSCYSILTFLYRHFKNRTYHPYLFRYMIGSSVGSLIIAITLNACFLYEQYNRKLAMKYIEEILKFLNYTNIRNVFYDVGNSKSLSITSIPNVIKNLCMDGSLFTRDSIQSLLIEKYEPLNFDNSQYFTNSVYTKWLDEHLNNVFIFAYSSENLTASIFTGNITRYRIKLSFYNNILLTSLNFIFSILCSSSIPLVFPTKKILGID